MQNKTWNVSVGLDLWTFCMQNDSHPSALQSLIVHTIEKLSKYKYLKMYNSVYKNIQRRGNYFASSFQYRRLKSRCTVCISHTPQLCWIFKQASWKLVCGISFSKSNTKRNFSSFGSVVSELWLTSIDILGKLEGQREIGKVCFSSHIWPYFRSYPSN